MPRKNQCFLLYDVEPVPGNPYQAILKNKREDEEYKFECLLQLNKNSHLYTLDISFLKFASDTHPFYRSGSRIERVLSIGAFFVLKKIIKRDFSLCKTIAMEKALKYKEKSFTISISKIESNNKMYSRYAKTANALMHKLTKVSGHWEKFFSLESKVLSLCYNGLVDSVESSLDELEFDYINMISERNIRIMEEGIPFVGKDDESYQKMKEISDIKIDKVQEINEALENNYVYYDLKNLSCYRRFMEKLVYLYREKRSKADYSGEGVSDICKSILAGWETILNADDSPVKKRIISNWPKLNLGIENLPNTIFYKYTNDILELKAHLALTDVFEISRFSTGLIVAKNTRASAWDESVLLHILEVLKNSDREDIKRAHRFWKKTSAGRRRQGGLHQDSSEGKKLVISYDRLKAMYRYIADGLDIILSGGRGQEITSLQKYIFNSRSLKRLVDLSKQAHNFERNLDQRIALLNTYRNMGIDESINPKNLLFPIPSDLIECDFEEEGINVRIIKNAQELKEEKELMSHCIFTYLKDFIKGNQYVFHLENSMYKATATVTILKNMENQVYFDQIHGPDNEQNEVTRQGREIIDRWCERLNRLLLKESENLFCKDVVL